MARMLNNNWTKCIPASVKAIEDETFSSCTSLSKITLEEGVESIDSKVFSGCTSLTSIDIPTTMNAIADDAFQGSSLTSINIKKRDGLVTADQYFSNWKKWGIPINWI